MPIIVLQLKIKNFVQIDFSEYKRRWYIQHVTGFIKVQTNKYPAIIHDFCSLLNIVHTTVVYVTRCLFFMIAWLDLIVKNNNNNNNTVCCFILNNWPKYRQQFYFRSFERMLIGLYIQRPAPEKVYIDFNSTVMCLILLVGETKTGCHAALWHIVSYIFHKMWIRDF